MITIFISTNRGDVHIVCIYEFYVSIFSVYPAIVINFLSFFLSLDGINYFYCFTFALNGKFIFND